MCKLNDSASILALLQHAAILGCSASCTSDASALSQARSDLGNSLSDTLWRLQGARGTRSVLHSTWFYQPDGTARLELRGAAGAGSGLKATLCISVTWDRQGEPR